MKHNKHSTIQQFEERWYIQYCVLLLLKHFESFFFLIWDVESVIFLTVEKKCFSTPRVLAWLLEFLGGNGMRYGILYNRCSSIATCNYISGKKLVLLLTLAFGSFVKFCIICSEFLTFRKCKIKRYSFWLTVISLTMFLSSPLCCKEAECCKSYAFFHSLLSLI